MFREYLTEGKKIDVDCCSGTKKSYETFKPVFDKIVSAVSKVGKVRGKPSEKMEGPYNDIMAFKVNFAKGEFESSGDAIADAVNKIIKQYTTSSTGIPDTSKLKTDMLVNGLHYDAFYGVNDNNTSTLIIQRRPALAKRYDTA